MLLAKNTYNASRTTNISLIKSLDAHPCYTAVLLWYVWYIVTDNLLELLLRPIIYVSHSLCKIIRLANLMKSV